MTISENDSDISILRQFIARWNREDREEYERRRQRGEDVRKYEKRTKAGNNGNG